MASAAPPPSTRRAAPALLVLTGVVGLMALLHVYLGLRLLRDPVLPPAAVVCGWVVLALLFFSMPLSLFARRRGRAGLVGWVVPLAYHWMGALGPVLSVVFGTDVVRWVATAVHGPWTAAERLSAARAQALAVVTLALPLVLWARLSAFRARVERVRVPLSNLGPGLEGLRIVQISDIHIGETLKRPFLERLVAQVNLLEPDVVAVTGDLVDGRVSELREDVAPLAGLRAPRGVYYVTGNHEYYWDGPAWEAEVRRLGLTVLRNEHRVIERNGDRLVMGGVTDFSAGAFAPGHASRPDLAFAEAPEGVPRVLLAHQPRSAQAAASAGVHLQLSGHTHGGQIFPFNLFVRLQQPTVRGLKRLFGLWVYTHRGTGFWGPPMRLGSAPEIAEITLIRP